MNESKLRIALLISGGGTTMREIIRATKDERLPRVTPALVIASRADAGGIEKARAEGIADENIVVLRPKAFDSPIEFGDALNKACRERGVDFVGQYGWLPLTPANFIESYQSMIVNQHPGPLSPGAPDFGGKGMYGRAVHCAVLYFMRATKHPQPFTEVVAHRVTAEYDKGKVLIGKRVPILETDDPITLQERALPVEHEVQIRNLHYFSIGDPHETTGSSFVRANEVSILDDAKRVGKLLFPKG